MACLQDLPDDILFPIFMHLQCPLISYPFPRLPRTKEEHAAAAFPGNHDETIYKDSPFPQNHPYLALAMQCRSFRDSIERFCWHLLVLRNATGWFGFQKAKAKRVQYLRWSWKRCLFCGMKTSVRAPFNAHMWCCWKCHAKEFGLTIVSHRIHFDLLFLRPNADQSGEDARRDFGVKVNWHVKYAHALFPEVYERPVDYATWCLSGSPQDKPSYLRKDIEKLGTVIKEYDRHGKRLGLLYRQVKGPKSRSNARIAEDEVAEDVSNT